MIAAVEQQHRTERGVGELQVGDTFQSIRPVASRSPRIGNRYLAGARLDRDRIGRLGGGEHGRVVAATADECVVAAAAVEHDVDLVGRVHGAGVDRVIAGAAVDRDGRGGNAGAAEISGDQSRVAGVAEVDDNLLNVGCRDLVVGVGRGDGDVGAGLDMHADIGSGADRDRIDVEGLGAAGDIEDVLRIGAGAAVDGVLPGSATADEVVRKGIVAGAAEEAVVAGAADKQVVAVRSGDGEVPARLRVALSRVGCLEVERPQGGVGDEIGAKVPEKLPLASSNAPIPSRTLLIALPAIVTPDALMPTIPVSDTGTPPFSAPLMWLLRMLRLVVSQNRMPVEVKLVGM
jgi:hypothetical protein